MNFFHNELSPAPNPLGGRIASVRMDLPIDPAFTSRFGKRVKSVGGTYSRTRGSLTDRRFVTMPIRKDTIDLIVSIAELYPPKTYVFERPRGADLGNASSWICVQKGPSFDKACCGFVASYENAIERGLAPTVAELDEQDRRYQQRSEEIAAWKASIATLPGAKLNSSGGYTVTCENGLEIHLSYAVQGVAFMGITHVERSLLTASEVQDVVAALGAIKSKGGE